MRITGFVVAALLFVAPAAFAAPCEQNTLEIKDGAVTASFQIEVAVTPQEQSRGLMFVESMPQFSGMLFTYHEPRPVAFWMKNTVIPLDILFIDQSGTVQKIHHNATPYSTDTIPGGNNIQFVFEINGGLSAMLGLGEGAVIRHPDIPSALAAWPCE